MLHPPADTPGSGRPCAPQIEGERVAQMHVFALGSSPSVRGPPVGDLVTWSGVAGEGFGPPLAAWRAADDSLAGRLDACISGPLGSLDEMRALGAAPSWR